MRSDLSTNANPLVETDRGPGIEKIPGRHGGDSSSGTFFSGATSSQTTTPASSTLLSFAGPNFSTVGADNGGYYTIPPDNASAAGPSNVVTAVNGVIEWFSKSGTLQNNQSLLQFFSSVTSVKGFSDPNATPAFDPKVAYDSISGRFVVVALEQSDAGGTDSNTSHILVAVSKDSDPNDGWTFSSINAETTANGQPCWADFPGLATDGSAIYITANLFSHSTGNYQGSRLWIASESSPGSVQVYDPSTASGATAAGPSEFFTLQPAQIYGAPAGGGTYLVSYDGAPSNTAAGQALNVIHVTDPFGASGPSFGYSQVNVGAIDAAPQYSSFTAPQAGTSARIDAGDDRALSAVWQNGNLYVTADVLPPSGPDAGHVTAHWFDVNTTSMSVATQGNVSGSAIASGLRTYDPSIAVDSNGDFVVNVSGSGPKTYASAYYSVDGGTGKLFAKGLAPYVRTFGGGDNRWGDFSSITPDPSSPTGFYAFNEYAWTRGTSILRETGRWATQVADINVPAGSGAGSVVAGGTTGTGSSGSPAFWSLLVQEMAAFGATGAGEAGGVNPPAGQNLTDFFAGATHHHG